MRTHAYNQDGGGLGDASRAHTYTRTHTYRLILSATTKREYPKSFIRRNIILQINNRKRTAKE